MDALDETLCLAAAGLALACALMADHLPVFSTQVVSRLLRRLLKHVLHFEDPIVRPLRSLLIF